MRQLYQIGEKGRCDIVTLASPVARDLILAAHVANTTGALLGSAGFGQLFRFNDISDSTNYSVIIGNQDSSNGRALHITYGTTGAATTIASFAKAAISLDVLTAFKHADLTNPAAGYTAIGARASDGRPVYYINGGSQSLFALTTDSVLLSTFTTAGDIVQATGAGAVARLGIGTARQNLQVNAGATALAYAASLQSLMTAQGDIVQASAANTPARLAIGTARQTLLVNAGATALEYGASLQSLMTAQGDIVYASAANTPARLAKGTAGLVLKMNAGATAPEWAAESAAGLVKLGEATGTGSATYLEVSSISGAYRSLYIEVDGGRSDTAATAVGVVMTVESSPTAGAYDGQRVYGANTTVTGDENIGAADNINCGSVPGASSSANLAGAIAIRIPGYASTGYFKSAIIDSASPTNIASGALFRFANMGVIELTAAISLVRLTLGSGNWTATSRMTVWGLPT